MHCMPQVRDRFHIAIELFLRASAKSGAKGTGIHKTKPNTAHFSFLSGDAVSLVIEEVDVVSRKNCAYPFARTCDGGIGGNPGYICWHFLPLFVYCLWAIGPYSGNGSPR